MLMTAYRAGKLKRLPEAEPQQIQPRISVIIASRNEGEALVRAVRHWLAQDYADLEVIAVDDRSDDGSGEAVRALAQQDKRLHYVRVEALPDGWLGKPHALHNGVEQATGAFLLFTDADVDAAPLTVRRAVAEMQRQKLDALSLLPDNPVIQTNLWLSVVVMTFGMLLLNRMRVEKSGQDNWFIGIGAFQLIRRSCFAKTPGIPWIRLEIIDDMALGKMIADAGGRVALADASDLLSNNWYLSVQAMVHGLEKNAFASTGFNPWRIVRGCLLLIGWFVLPPLLAVYNGNYAWLATYLAIFFLLPGIGGLFQRRGVSHHPLSLFLLPFGMMIMLYAVTRAMLLTYRRGGVLWRGTLYPLRLLKENQRFQM